METRRITDIFERSLSNLRDDLLPILGETTVDAIIRNAVRENLNRYHFLSSATINVHEISFANLHEEETSFEPEELIAGILGFLQSIITLLTELTGDVLTRKAETLQEELQKSIKEGQSDNR